MLINNAGVVSGRALLDTPDYLIERSFNVNVLAHFWVCYGFCLVLFICIAFFFCEKNGKYILSLELPHFNDFFPILIFQIN